MNDLGIDKKQHYIIKKMINLVIKAAYFILCGRNKIWDSSDLLKVVVCLILVDSFITIVYKYMYITQFQVASC